MSQSAPSLCEGDRAPEVELTMHTGETIALADLWRDRVVILFFYPKDGTLVCTKEACAFRDAFEEFHEAGATVVGVSGDSAEAHRAFADRHRLPFLLATDTNGALRRAFGVPKTMGILPGRVTYVIDREGIIRRMFSAQFAADRHVREARESIGGLR
jgi:peroxiredoxin Q/BCP